MSRVIAAVVVAVLVLATAGPVVATAGSPDLSVHLPENRVAAGEETTLDVFLLNGGNVTTGGPPNEETRVTTARNVTVTLRSGAAPIDVRTATQPVGNVPEGRVGPIQFAVSVAETAAPGRYDVPVRIAYDFTGEIDSSDGTRESTGRTIERTVTLVVEERARFAVVDATTDAVLGGTGDVTLALENVGSATAFDARVTFRSTDPGLTFDGSATAGVFVGDWAPGEVRTATVRARFAPGAALRTFPVSATVTSEDVDGVSRTSEPLQSGLRPRAEQSFALENVSSTLAVGDEGTLRGVVTNTGETPARNAVVVLSADNANVVPAETEYAVGDIGPGESTTFAFDAEVSDSADAGPRQLSFVVRYRDTVDAVHRSDPLDARVEVGPRRGVFAVEPASATFDAGETGVLELRVSNVGDRPVTDVSAKLFADDPLSSSDDEAFIDRLEPGASRTVRFALTVDSGALRKIYPVSLDFQYDDAEGDTRLSDTYDVPVEVTRSQDGDGPSLPVIGGAAVLVVALLVGGRWYWRQR